MTLPRLVMFDLDGTLAESKAALSKDIAAQVAKLLEQTRVAVVSGGGLPQFLAQVVSQLPADTNLSNLYLLPTSGAALYEWHDCEWQKVYQETLSETEAKHIADVITKVARETGLINFDAPSYGERIEYRGGEETLSALGQRAPVALKQKWDPDKTKRQILQKELSDALPGYHVGMGGATSIDITREGIDKAYGINQLAKRLQIPEAQMLYVGDQLVAGGNDEPVFKTSAVTRPVKDPAETAAVIKQLLAQNQTSV